MLTQYSDIKIKEFLQGRQSVVALGNFDGVHLAHRFLICKAADEAKKNGLKSVVYTFDRHPKSFFGGSVEYITEPCEKAALIESTGADMLYFQKTDPEFLKLSPYSFAKNILVDTFNISLAVVGEHYTFGANGAGNADTLTRLGSELGFKTQVLPLIKKDGELVSSTNIREHLKAGRVREAGLLLGRSFSVTGVVESGNKIGRSLGFPTINIYPAEGRVMPRLGVYAATAQLCGREYKAILNIGVKPTVGSDRVVIEAHLFDAEGDFYGKEVKIYFDGFVREEKRFESLDKLKAQIELDKELVKNFQKNSL